jgi:hypothetical protein
LAALSGTRMVKRKAKERFWKYCLTPSLSDVFTGPVTSLGGPRMKLLPGFHRRHRYNFPVPVQVLLQFSLDIGSMYKETGLNDANVFSTQIAAVSAGIFFKQKNDKRITHP